MSVQAFDIIFAGNLPNLFIDRSPSTTNVILHIIIINYLSKTVTNVI